MGAWRAVLTIYFTTAGIEIPYEGGAGTGVERKAIVQTRLLFFINAESEDSIREHDGVFADR